MALPSLAKLTGSLLRLLLLLLLEVIVVVVVATGLDWSMMVHSDSWTRLSSRSQNCTGFRLLLQKQKQNIRKKISRDGHSSKMICQSMKLQTGKVNCIAHTSMVIFYSKSVLSCEDAGFLHFSSVVLEHLFYVKALLSAVCLPSLQMLNNHHSLQGS